MLSVYLETAALGGSAGDETRWKPNKHGAGAERAGRPGHGSVCSELEEFLLVLNERKPETKRENSTASWKHQRVSVAPTRS